eukprot:TRINITY_DN1967_c0_g2_i1.p1 TRINITY_DN1967_c0_g2~~TRINITY_DN1967_c0_g2_i1.p1  ORF type:complete len:210 (+),score=43.49 TRINITY_DN1967_c0_g2_i1:647-1276(+)
MRDTKERLGLLHEMVGEKEGSGLVDIREEYNSDEEDSDDDSDYEETTRQHQRANVVNQESREAIDAMFARLEAQEAASLAAEQARTQPVADSAPAFSSPADIYNHYMNQQTREQPQPVASRQEVQTQQVGKTASKPVAASPRGILKNTRTQQQHKAPLGAKESSAFSGEIKERPVAPVVKDTIAPVDNTANDSGSKPKRQSKFMQSRRK